MMEVPRTGPGADYDKLADVLAREHGKTVPTPRATLQRGLEVVAVRLRHPASDEGRIHGGRRPGIRSLSLRQATLGAWSPASRRSISPDDPDVKSPAIACGQRFILSRPSAIRRADDAGAID